MALFTLADVTTPATREEVQAALYRIFDTVGIATTAWEPGSVVRTQVVATSSMLAALSDLQAQLAQSGFMELAQGEWLTLCARYVYGVERIESSYATGFVDLVNEGGGVFDVEVDDLIVNNPTTGKAYRNGAPFQLGAGQTLLGVPVIAAESGAASTSGPGQIKGMTSAMLKVSVTNPAAVVGNDAESDAALRARCREKLGTLSPNGPADAYSYVARSATRPPRPSDDNIGVTRTRVLKDGYGHVVLVVADADGPIAPEDVAIINEDIQHLATPLAVSSSTVSAQAVPISIAYEIFVYNTSGNSDQQIRDAVRVQLSKFFSLQPIGGNLPAGVPPGYVYNDAIRSAIASTLAPGLIFHVVLSSPAGDVQLQPSDVATFTTPTSEIVHQVPVPEGASL